MIINIIIIFLMIGFIISSYIIFQEYKNIKNQNEQLNNLENIIKNISNLDNIEQIGMNLNDLKEQVDLNKDNILKELENLEFQNDNIKLINNEQELINNNINNIKLFNESNKIDLDKYKIDFDKKTQDLTELINKQDNILIEQNDILKNDLSLYDSILQNINNLLKDNNNEIKELNINKIDKDEHNSFINNLILKINKIDDDLNKYITTDLKNLEDINKELLTKQSLIDEKQLLIDENIVQLNNLFNLNQSLINSLADLKVDLSVFNQNESDINELINNNNDLLNLLKLKQESNQQEIININNNELSFSSTLDLLNSKQNLNIENLNKLNSDLTTLTTNLTNLNNLIQSNLNDINNIKNGTSLTLSLVDTKTEIDNLKRNKIETSTFTNEKSNLINLINNNKTISISLQSILDELLSIINSNEVEITNLKSNKLNITDYNTNKQQLDNLININKNNISTLSSTLNSNKITLDSNIVEIENLKNNKVDSTLYNNTYITFNQSLSKYITDILNLSQNSTLVNNDLKDLSSRVFPSRTIIAFNGTSIPSGWVECDGFNSTPDLRARCIIGRNDSILSGRSKRPFLSTGGSETHTLTINEIPPHDHLTLNRNTEILTKSTTNFTDGFDKGLSSQQLIKSVQLNSELTGSTGGSMPHNNMQPYFVLVYIMKT